MGFSLKAFFESLEYILKNEQGLHHDEQLTALRQEIERSKRYAEECGHLEAGRPCAHYREAYKPRTVAHIPDSSGLTLPQLEAGKRALYSCSEDPSFDDVRAVIAAVAQGNPTK